MSDRIRRNRRAIPDAWSSLRTATPARIALGRAGGSLPTHELLAFELAHARARDAVHEPFAAEMLAEEIARLGVETLVVDSAAGDRETYLARPDLGRRLSSMDYDRIAAWSGEPPEVAIVVSDGLSALAAQRHAVPLLASLLPALSGKALSSGPLVIVRHGRVAIQDEVGQLLRASAAIILLGERPGLTSPDSLGAYLVYEPRVGRTDADRNCVSNIRPEGLPPPVAAETLCYLLTESLRRRLSGVALKDERPSLSSHAPRQRLEPG